MPLTQVTSGGIQDGAITSTNLADSGVTAGTHGSATAIPGITVNAKGLITGVTTHNISTGFEAGTKLLFQQTNAPTGWTKSTTHNDKTLRVVSGAASSGGSTAFTSVFASRTPSGTVGSTTLTTSQMPSHAHQVSSTFKQNSTFYSTFLVTSAFQITTASTSGGAGFAGSNTTGGGSSHDHSFTGSAMDFAVQYVDVIIATKD